MGSEQVVKAVKIARALNVLENFLPLTVVLVAFQSFIIPFCFYLIFLDIPSVVPKQNILCLLSLFSQFLQFLASDKKEKRPHVTEFAVTGRHLKLRTENVYWLNQKVS